jgi:predicted nucleic acid-binding protein
VTVVDASAMVELLLGRPSAGDIARHVAVEEAAAPAHFDAEVLGGLARAERLRLAEGSVVERAVGQLRASPIVRFPLPHLVEDAWRRRANLSLADALYVSLAAFLGAPLVTVDRRLASAPLTGVTVLLVG